MGGRRLLSCGIVLTSQIAFVCGSSNPPYNAYNYDLSTPQFTPDGRLMQVEYASRAPELGEMKCTGRRLIGYTLCVVFVSYGSAYLIHAQAPVMPFGLGEVVLPAVGTFSPTSQSAETTSETAWREGSVVSGAVTKVSPPPPPKSEQPAPEQTPKSKDSPPPHPYEPPASPPSAINDTVPVKHAAGKYVKPKSDKPEDNQLTTELVDHYAEDNVVMVTWANNHYLSLIHI